MTPLVARTHVDVRRSSDRWDELRRLLDRLEHLVQANSELDVATGHPLASAYDNRVNVLRRMISDECSVLTCEKLRTELQQRKMKGKR